MIRPPTPTVARPVQATGRRRASLVAMAAALAVAVTGALFLGGGTAGAAASSTDGCTPQPVATQATPPPPVTGRTDTEAPTAPGKPVIAICDDLLTVTWAPSTDNVGVTSYIVGRLIGDIAYQFAVTTNGWSTSTWYGYENIWVVAVDAAGNRSLSSGVATYGTAPSCPPPLPPWCAGTTRPPTSVPVTTGPDTQAPTAPGKPVVTVANGVATVSWAASTDNVGVVSYQVIHQWTDIVEIVTVAAPATSRDFTVGTSNTQHIFSVIAKDAAGNVSPSSGQTSIGTPPSCPAPAMCTSSPPPTSAPPTSASGIACAVTYTTLSVWPGGFQAEIRIRNTGSVPLDPWTLEFDFPNGQQVSQLWNATHTQSGAKVTAAALSWNRLIPPGGSVTIGFIGTWTDTNAPPTRFIVNGTVCSIG